MPLTFKGQTGQLKAGYQVAAQLANWTLVYGRPHDAEEVEGPRSVWTLTTALRDVDLFWLTRERFDLVLEMGRPEQAAYKQLRLREVAFRIPDCPTCEFTIQGEGRPEIR